MALCGMGAASHYSGYGTYLYRITPELLPVENPTYQNVTVANWGIWSPQYERGQCTAYAMGIKFTPLPFDPPIDPILSCDKEKTASEADSSGHLPGYDALKAIDKIPATRWISTNIPNPWIRLTLPNQRPICRVDIMWANEKPYVFNISTSTDGNTFVNVYLEFITRSGTNADEFESYYFTSKDATDVKLSFAQIGPFGTIAEIKEVKIFSGHG